MIGQLFSLFDETISNYKCLKIETIGDAYFAVSGCPEPYENHASEIGTNIFSNISWKFSDDHRIK
jgi:class 3 adenylate cyclase